MQSKFEPRAKLAVEDSWTTIYFGLSVGELVAAAVITVSITCLIFYMSLSLRKRTSNVLIVNSSVERSVSGDHLI